MKVCVVGWYGTETLGDRSILLGIASVFDTMSKGDKCDISVASLYPFLTKRSLFEDNEFIKELAPNTDVSYFDVKDDDAFRKEILSSDYVVMGGGPLMDLDQLIFIEDAFRFAQSRNIPTILFGCGVGPLKEPHFIKCVSRILKYSSLCIFRDEVSKEQAIEICKSYGNSYDGKMHVCYDPAFIPPLFYKEHYCQNIEQTNETVVNLRKYPFAIDENGLNQIMDNTHKLFENILTQCDKIQLLPNHSFYVGGDDRSYYADYWINHPDDRIEVAYKPLSLMETFEQIATKKYCIGMRYHAILFHTVLNGNNYLLDYTEPKVGKISEFLRMINGNDFYDDRHYNILDCPKSIPMNEDKFVFPFDSATVIREYIRLLNS